MKISAWDFVSMFIAKSTNLLLLCEVILLAFV